MTESMHKNNNEGIVGHDLHVIDASPAVQSSAKEVISVVYIIERPEKHIQMYVAKGLQSQSHFSCPTVLVPFLLSEVSRIQNVPIKEIVFVPNKCNQWKSDTLLVINDIPSLNEIVVGDVISEVREMSGDQSSSNSLSSTKRSNHSISIGLQLQYSYLQHRARYSMLPNSKPHVNDVKHYSRSLRHSILSIYNYILRYVNTSTGSYVTSPGINVSQTRRSLRNDLLQYLKQNVDEVESINITPDTMFEACTVQPTGALAIHCDKMNCPKNDQTYAVLVPDVTLQQQCVSFLYYSRKTVSEFVHRMENIEQSLTDSTQCPLMRLCLRLILGKRSIFDYQGSLYENESSLDELGGVLEKHPKHAIPGVEQFCGMKCFKHGAAFDKMGYYSLFLSSMLSMHYMNVIENKYDVISLCMYFGLLCNGTSSLAAVWTALARWKEESLLYLKNKKSKQTRVFALLVNLDRCVRDSSEASGVVGSCKLNRFQYPSYAPDIVNNKKRIMGALLTFLSEQSKNMSKSRAMDMHKAMYKKLRELKIKGIGPMTFNQLWHALCLSGVLPTNYLHFSMVSTSAGPANIIQCFYPMEKTESILEKRLHSLKTSLLRLGFKQITEFFLENMLCEIWRLACKHNRQLIKGKTDNDAKEKYLLSDEFYQSFITSGPTQHPDIYYHDPVRPTHYQHLFRVKDTELMMRPSASAINGRYSSFVVCNISYEKDDGAVIKIAWKGDLIRLEKQSPNSWFIA